MRVVPAGVHPSGVRGREGQARLLRDGQGVHVRSERQRVPGPGAPNHRGDAAFPDPRPDLRDSRLLQPFNDEGRRVPDVEPHLRVKVDVPTPAHHLPVQFPRLIPHAHALHCNILRLSQDFR